MSTYTSSLGLEQITPGDQAGLWGNTTNNNLALIDQAVTGVTPISFAALSGQTYTLTDFDGAVDESRSAVLNITGIASGSNTVVIPNKQKMYLVRNNTGQNVVFQTPTPTATYTVGAGNSILIFCDGNNNVFTGIASPSVGTLSVSAGGTGSTTFTAGFLVSTGGTNSLTTQPSIGIGGTAPDQVTGQLSVGKGGTGATSFASGGLLRGNGASPVDALVGTAGVPGQVATWNGSQWTAAAPSAAGVSSVSAGTGISVSGSTGAVTIGNTGVTSISAGPGISISGSTGGVTISTSGSSGITAVSGSTTITANTVGSGVTISQTQAQVFTAIGYTPVQPNGTGASGTWGISISGTAASASSATNATNATNVSGGTVSASTGTFTGRVVVGNGSAGTNFNLDVLGQSGQTAAFITTAGSGGNGISINAVNTSSCVLFQNNGVFNGSITVSGGSTFYNTTSDRRLKDNIVPLENTGAIIDALKPRQFTWKPTGEATKGFIADEFQQVMPNAVQGNPNEVDSEGNPKYQAVDCATPEMIALLVAEVQSLRKRVAELEAKP